MKKLLILALILFPGSILFAQDDLMKELEESDKNDTDYAFQTFKGTRLINGHTVETKPKNTLEFIFAHRFGAIKTGAYHMFGLDLASVRLGLDYGITDNISASIGRNSTDKTMDGYLKYKIIRQSKGARNFPVTITGLSGMGYKGEPKQDTVTGIDRLSYVHQLHIARKFTTKFSFQLSPTFVHKNFVIDSDTEPNDQFALGMGGRIKLTKSVALTTEYYYRLNVPDGNTKNNALGFGIDIETGGHVFQLVITNSARLTERSFITETVEDFGKGDIHFGFNVTRTFQLNHKK